MATPPEELRYRTKRFALRIIQLFRCIPKTVEARALGYQLLRSGTSVAANYRAACRARSKAESIAKIGIVVEEADEALFWLEIIVEAGLIKEARVAALMQEARELLAIFAASHRTAKLSPHRRIPG